MEVPTEETQSEEPQEAPVPDATPAEETDNEPAAEPAGEEDDGA